MKIKIDNPNLNSEERTYLTSDYSSGTSLTVRNNDGLTDDWFVIVGEPGQEQSEARQISATTGNTTVTLASALRFSHPKSCPVYLCQWDKWGFESKATGGSFATISGSPFAIEWDDQDLTTTIVYSGGVTTDTYRWRPYNSVTATYGTYSDELPGTGLTRKQVGYLIKQAKKNPIASAIDDETMIDYFNDFQDLVYDEIPQAWWFSKTGDQVATAESTSSYSISDNWSDLLSIKFLMYRYVSGDSTDITYSLTFSPEAEMRSFKSDANQSDDDNAKYWSLYPPDDDSAKGYIIIHPTSATVDCYIQPVYYFELTRLNSFGDTIVVPYPKGYINYVLYRIYDDIKSDTENANKYNSKIRSDIVALKRRAKRQLGQPELFRFRGTRGWSRLFGEQSGVNNSDARENYW